MSTVNLGRTYLDTHTHSLLGEMGEREVAGGSSGTATSFIMSSFMAQCATAFFCSVTHRHRKKHQRPERRPQVGGGGGEAVAVVAFEYYRNTAAQ